MQENAYLEKKGFILQEVNAERKERNRTTMAFLLPLFLSDGVAVRPRSRVRGSTGARQGRCEGGKSWRQLGRA